ncbi:MAG: ABC transporter permease [Caldilineaceae bacterium]|nr:ABC transporter permease [Caldilineaceae bacterium]
MSVARLEQRVNAAPVRETKSRSEWMQSWRRFRANRAAVVGLVFLILICIGALFAHLLVPYDPTFSYPGMRGVGPSWEHPLGFDHIGRDLLARVVYGARVALLVGLGSTVISVGLGVLIGAISGYFGGWIDTILSRIVDTLMAFPLLALLIVLAAVLGPSLTTTIVVIGVTTWARFARVVRADVMAIRQTDYVTAARASGVQDFRIIFRHVLPNVLGPVIVLATLGIGSIIILESSLSFLGLGIQPPTASWGGTLADGRSLIRQFPLITFFPGVMIFFTVLAFNLLGDGLRDALDPRQRG